MAKLVYVVEDDPGIRSALSDILSMEGYEPKPFTNGKEAFDDLIRTDREPSLVVLDLMMPRMNGYQFLEELSQFADLVKIPVIVVSADEMATSRLAGNDQVDLLMKKPIDVNCFLEAVGRLAN